MTEKYWLLRWMDENGIRSDWHVDKFLKSRPMQRSLRDFVERIPYTTEPLPKGSRPDFVLTAGRGIDLSGDLECLSWRCKKGQVDRLFARVWHYFDKVVVVGIEADPLKEEVSQWSDQKRHALEQMMRLLLYLRNIGAEDLLLFRQKSPPCKEHLADHFTEAGLPDPYPMFPQLVEDLVAEGHIRAVREHDDHIHFAFDHPLFMHSAFATVSHVQVRQSESIKHAAAGAVVLGYVSRLASDALTAKRLNTPLGTDLGYYRHMLAKLTRTTTAGDVALELQLPVLDGVNPADLIALRSAEAESFERFRSALRVAIAARLKEASPSASAIKVARDIEMDLIAPALADIERKLKKASAVVAKKAAIGISVGAFATTCGVLFDVTTLAAAGVAAAMALLGAEFKHIEERRDVELSDLYFMWQASHHH